jgi:uncharacterized protein YgiM (DUF1202 family)
MRERAPREKGVTEDEVAGGTSAGNVGRSMARGYLMVTFLGLALTGCAAPSSGAASVVEASPTAELTATLQPRPTLPPPPSPTIEPTVTATATPQPLTASVTADYLNLRAEPSAEAAIVRTLARGEVLTVLGFNGDQSWTQVASAQGQGWVNSTYIEVMVPVLAAVTPTAP